MEKPSEGNCRAHSGRNVPGNQAAVGAQRCQTTAVAEGCRMGTELQQWHSLLPSKLCSCCVPAQTFLPACPQLVLHLSLVCWSFSSLSGNFLQGIFMHVTGTAAHLGESRSAQALLVVDLKAGPSCLRAAALLSAEIPSPKAAESLH